MLLRCIENAPSLFLSTYIYHGQVVCEKVLSLANCKKEAYNTGGEREQTKHKGKEMVNNRKLEQYAISLFGCISDIQVEVSRQVGKRI